ncbi:hypothetical protein WJX73_000493 [Symbiochloris irregularis]|uniref:Uncharacterized protein n=1 Tax=Symbiochloris irregularis TaxID=706552 RepID=A0AAW1P946_9CHLO
MGRRDKRTKKGKIFKKSFGKCRSSSSKHSDYSWWHLPKSIEEEFQLKIPIPLPQRRPAPGAGETSALPFAAHALA